MSACAVFGRLVAVLAGVAVSCAGSYAATDEKAPSEKPPLKEVGKGRYTLDSIAIDQNLREVRFPAEVNMAEGLVEVFLCSEYGKRHESLLYTKVDPTFLNVAFILIELQGGQAVKFLGDPTKPEGSAVEISLKWKDEAGKPRTVRAEDWVYNVHKKAAMERTHWVYVGSVFEGGEFMAKATGTLIATFHDPYTLIDNPLPEGGDDTAYTVFKDRVPKVGTKVEVIVRAVAKVPPREGQKGEGEKESAPR